jgi:transcription elongation factor GreB
MSRGFIKEGDQEAIPMVPPRAFLPDGVPNFVTKEGLAALNEELKSLEAERTKTGDNYIVCNFIDAKMKLLISRIASAVEVDLAKANKNTVSFGAWVRYNGRTVRIVGVDEANVDQGLVSFISPIAKALTGKKAGDVFELKGPGGTERIVVEAVSYEPMTLTQIVREKPLETLAAPERKNTKSIEKEWVQVMPTPQAVKDEAVAMSANREGPRRFEPEVNPMEFLPIVNERGIIVGRALYLELHKGNKMLHPVVHLHVLNGQGATTRRYWWHVAFGDTAEKTLQRKMTETLGRSGLKPMLKRQYIREDKTEKELVYVFTIVTEEDLPNTPEGKDYNDLFAND